MSKRTNFTIHCLFAALVIAIPARMASGAPVFSQTEDSVGGADGSDRDAFSRKGIQSADDVTLKSDVTVKSVTWWGVFVHKDTPKTPVSFDLIFYADADGVPDASTVLSTTTVVFDTLKDTGDELRSGKSIYEFRAGITPAPLSAGVKVWFSVLADTSEDDDDDFQWAHDLNT